MKFRKRSSANVLAWVLLAILAGATAAWVVWAARQPEVPSIWAPE
jgi:hypothetical protein